MLHSGFFSGKHARWRSRVLNFFQDSRKKVISPWEKIKIFNAEGCRLEVIQRFRADWVRESNSWTNFLKARAYLAFLCLVIKKYSVFDKWIVSFYLLMSKLIRLWNSKDINYCPFRHFKSPQLILSWFPADPSVCKPFQIKLRGLILKNRNCVTVNDVECS